MKQNLKNIFFKTIVVSVLLASMLQAKFHLIRNDNDFDRLINQYDFSIVCFAPAHGTDDEKEEFKNLQNRVKAAAGRDDFKTVLKNDVGFLVVDSSSKKAQDLSYDYKISKFPTCMAFGDGVAVGTSIFAPQSASELIKLLEQNFGKKLEQLTKDRKEDVRLDRQERIASYYAYANSPYYWYPYAVWPYTRWGVYPYGLGWGFDVC